MYLQSIHLTRLLSRLITVKSLQSEWRTTELFSAECGAPQNSSRVASANLILYPTIIPGISANKPLNAAQTEMHAVVRSGAVAEWIEHPPVFIHFSITGNICDWKIFYSPWCPLCEQWQHLWGQGEKWIYLPVAWYISIYLGLQLAIRDQSRTAERWLNVLFGLAA